MLRQAISKLGTRFKASKYGPSWGAFVYVAALVMGVFCGATAAMLKWGVSWVKDFVFGRFSIHQGNWVILLLPIFGIFIAALVTRYLARSPLDHASERVADDLSTDNLDISPRELFGSVIGCSFTLGLGGSAGAESPVAYSGAAIGSCIGRVFGLSKYNIYQLLGCGAAAGIAGIYMAPIGGAMFALEILKMKQDLQTSVVLVLSSLISALTCYVLLGCHTDVQFVPEMRFDTMLIPYVLGCGVLCGIYSAYNSYMIKRCKRVFTRAANVWLRALYGGLALAGLLYLFPSLYGEGYGILSQLMTGDTTSLVAYSPLYRWSGNFWLLMLMCVVLLLVKPVATSATNDSGGVGGDFTPTFFCGGIVGIVFASLMHHLFGVELPTALFVFFGMAAVMSGAKQAPLMAIFIASEMTGLYGFILPLTLAALASFGTVYVLGGIDLRKYLPHLK